MQGSARGTALVVLVAAPLSIAGMTIARRGQIAGLMLWLGAVAYLLYNAVLFLFATPYNRLFLLDVAFLALAIFTLIRLVMVARTHSVSESPRARRWLAGYIWSVVVLNSVAWLSGIGPEPVERPAGVDHRRAGRGHQSGLRPRSRLLAAGGSRDRLVAVVRAVAGNRAGGRPAELLGARVGFHRRRSSPRRRRRPVIASWCRPLSFPVSSCSGPPRHWPSSCTSEPCSRRLEAGHRTMADPAD